jgi:hypothetical protein
MGGTSMNLKNTFCKKQKWDPKMPISLPLLCQQCIIVQGHMSPDCLVHESDNNHDDIEVEEIRVSSSSVSIPHIISTCDKIQDLKYFVGGESLCV